MPSSPWFRIVLLEKSAEALVAADFLSLLEPRWLASARFDAIWLILPPKYWAVIFIASTILMLRGVWRSNTGQVGLCLLTIAWGVWLTCYGMAFWLEPTSPLPMMFAAYMTLSNFLILAAPAVRRWN